MKRRLVIADDDPTIVTLVSLRLETENYEIFTAASGDEASPLETAEADVSTFSAMTHAIAHQRAAR